MLDRNFVENSVSSRPSLSRQEEKEEVLIQMEEEAVEVALLARRKRMRICPFLLKEDSEDTMGIFHRLPLQTGRAV